MVYFLSVSIHKHDCVGIILYANGLLPLVHDFQARLAITLVWKVQLQQFKHFYIACSKLFHMVRLNQECFSTQI